MKVLVLTKRQYMGQDLLDDHFGRFWELPMEVARLGHLVQGLALSYRQRPEGTFTDQDCSVGVRWHSVNLLNGRLPQLKRYTRRAWQISHDFRPDIVWACSDVHHAIFGSWLAQRVQARCVVDLYDNFEAFTGSWFPGVLPVFRRAVSTANGVTFFSRRLADYATQTYMLTNPATVIENGITRAMFYPQNKHLCRKRLGLPANATIIGTAGALYRSRGIETLFRAFARLSTEIDDLHLLIAGPRERTVSIPSGPRVHDLAQLPHAEVPLLYKSLDVAVVCYRQSAQGEYSLPQKAYEIIASRVPLVAAAVGSMNELLRNYPDCLYQPEDSDDLAGAIKRQLDAKRIIEIATPSWADSAKQLSDFFLRVLDCDSAPPPSNKHAVR